MAYNQTHWRLRSDDTVALNNSTDWAALEDTSATIGMGTRFRLRIKITEDAGSGSANQDIHLQARHPQGSNTWHSIRNKSDSDVASLTPAAVVRTSSQYTDGNSTTELLTDDGDTFLAGQGEEDNVLTTDISNQSTEIEWTLFVLRWYEDTDGVYNEISIGDDVEFRVVLGTAGSGTAFGGATQNIASLTVGQTDYYVGGTLSETPNQCLWVDGNGNLYACIEPTSTYTPVMMIKSTDNGVTWTEIDSANKPTATDMESVDGVLVGDTIYLIVQQNDEPTHHTFHTSTHSTTPDSWGVVDDVVEAGIAAADQCVTIERRSNGDLVAFYIKDESALDTLWGNVKPDGGSWGTPFAVENEASHWVKGISTVISPVDDLIYIFYRAIEDTVSGELYMRTFDSNDNLSGRTQMDVTGDSEGDRMSTAVHPVLWDNGGTETVMVAYIDFDDVAMYSQVVEDGTISGSGNRKRIDDTDVYQGGDSEQLTAVMDINTNDDTVHVIFADETTQDIWHDENTNNGSWGSDTEVADGVTCERLVGLLYTKSNNDIVMSFIYDEESSGFMGDTFYDEHFIASAAETESVSDGMDLGDSATSVIAHYSKIKIRFNF